MEPVSELFVAVLSPSIYFLGVFVVASLALLLFKGTQVEKRKAELTFVVTTTLAFAVIFCGGGLFVWDPGFGAYRAWLSIFFFVVSFVSFLTFMFAMTKRVRMSQ